MAEIVCTKCEQSKDEDQFFVSRRKKSGRTRQCKDCRYNKDTCYHLRSTYGITLKDYEKMWVAQRGVCAICDQPETSANRGRLRRLAVDHCHDTGVIRGLLCFRCNTAIGKMGHDTNILRSAIEYLEPADLRSSTAA